MQIVFIAQAVCIDLAPDSPKVSPANICEQYLPLKTLCASSFLHGVRIHIQISKVLDYICVKTITDWTVWLFCKTSSILTDHSLSVDCVCCELGMRNLIHEASDLRGYNWYFLRNKGWVHIYISILIRWIIRLSSSKNTLMTVQFSDVLVMTAW